MSPEDYITRSLGMMQHPSFTATSLAPLWQALRDQERTDRQAVRDCLADIAISIHDGRPLLDALRDELRTTYSGGIRWAALLELYSTPNHGDTLACSLDGVWFAKERINADEPIGHDGRCLRGDNAPGECLRCLNVMHALLDDALDHLLGLLGDNRVKNIKDVA